MKLTKRAVDAATYTGTGNARCVLWDDEIPGFGLRIFPSGHKSFLLSYRTAGRKRLLTLGAYGVLTVDQAREDARAKLGKVLTAGADPLADKQRDRQGETIRDLCQTYMERHGNAKKTGQEDLRRINQHILPRWGSYQIAALTRADVAALHTKLGKSSVYVANRTVALLSKMFALASLWGFVPEGHINPARRIARFKEVKRDRWVTAEELPRLAQAINEEDNPVARNGLWLYLLTGCRKTEILRAKWDDVDLSRAELRLPDTKSGRVHYIPLSAPALALLRSIPRADGSPYLLPGRGLSGHLVNIQKPWTRVRAAAGVADVRLHDLRRTVGSWLAQAGNSLHLIGKVLNHSSPSTTQIYARFGDDSVRTALEQHGAKIMGVAGLAPLAEVVDLPTKTAKQN